MLATVTGTIYRQAGVGNDPTPAAGVFVEAEPLLLDESGAIVVTSGAETRAASSSGVVTFHLEPGLWRFRIADGEIIAGADGAGVLLAPGASYDLHTDLRGYVAPPLTSVQVIQVPQDLAADVALALDVKADVEALLTSVEAVAGAAVSDTQALIATIPATADAAVASEVAEQISPLIATATTKAGEAAQSALDALGSENAASDSAGDSATSAGESLASAGLAHDSADAAAMSAGAASESAVAALDSAGASANSAGTATQKASDANDSALAAAESAGTATTKAGEAAQSALDALGSANAAAGSAGDAATSAGDSLASANLSDGYADAAGLSAGAAAQSALDADGFADAASASAGAAAGSAGAAAQSALDADGFADAASASAGAASGSATAASTSAGTATTKAGEANASAIAAAASQNAAAATLAGAVTKATLTTKGDTFAASGNATPVRVPVGADGAALMADSTQTPGVKWSGATELVKTTAQTLSTAEKTQALANLGVTPGTTVGAMPYVSANGTVKFQPVVPFLKNMLTNSDFSNGTTGWTGNNGAITATGGVITQTSNGTSGSPGVAGGAMATPTVIGNTYYVAVKSRSNGPVAAFRTYDGTTTKILSGSVTQGVYAVRSLTYVARAALTLSYFYHSYASAAAALNQTMDIDWTILIDLTATFGAGFEPSQAEMDALMAQWGGWFADTDPKLLPSYVWAKRTQGAAVNLCGNGDFSQGTTGWTPNAATQAVTGGVMTLTGTGATANPYTIGGAAVGYPRVGQKLYSRVMLRAVTGAAPTNMVVTAGGVVAASQAAPVVGTWYLLSGVITALTTGADCNTALSITYASTGDATGATVEAKQVLYIDLTAAFGAGNEPTKSEMDLLLTKYQNSWFNGTVNDLVKDFDKWNRRGTGSPEGVVTAAPGVKWTDTANTNGAKEWRKGTGTGNTGWIVTVGDTGWRDVSTLLINGWTATAGQILARRTTDSVYLNFEGMTGAAATLGSMMTLPVGFRTPGAQLFRMLLHSSGGSVKRVIAYNSGVVSFNGTVPDSNLYGLVLYPADAAWPTTLPGTAV